LKAASARLALGLDLLPWIASGGDAAAFEDAGDLVSAALGAGEDEDA
jgi:hypothetical protein